MAEPARLEFAALSPKILFPAQQTYIKDRLIWLALKAKSGAVGQPLLGEAPHHGEVRKIGARVQAPEEKKKVEAKLNARDYAKINAKGPADQPGVVASLPAPHQNMQP